MPSAKYQREWKKRNPEKRKRYIDRYNHSFKAKACQQRYRDKNKEARNMYCREWYKDNKESVLKRNTIYFKTDKGKRVKAACEANRRGAKGSFTAEDIKDLYVTQGARCYYCSVEIENGFHVDHMTPLSRGGRNDVSNICLACAPCNMRKHTKTAEEFQGARGNVCYQG